MTISDRDGAYRVWVGQILEAFDTLEEAMVAAQAEADKRKTHWHVRVDGGIVATAKPTIPGEDSRDR